MKNLLKIILMLFVFAAFLTNSKNALAQQTCCLEDWCCTDTCARCGCTDGVGCCWSCAGGGPIWGICGAYFSFDEAAGNCPVPPANTPTPTLIPTRPPTPTPTPFLPPQCAPPTARIESTSCSEDHTTGSMYLKWTSLAGASVYRLEIDTSESFDANPHIPNPGNYTDYRYSDFPDPETTRYARVRGEVVLGCEDPTAWSSTLAINIDCTDDGGSSSGTEYVLAVFCDADGNPTTDPGSGKFYTAIGCVPARETQTFTEFTLRWGIGVAAGIAFLLMIYAGYLYMTSSGDPRKLQAAKELFTAAVGGLIYLLFSMLIFRMVAADILKIPGIDENPGSCSCSFDDVGLCFIDINDCNDDFVASCNPASCNVCECMPL